MNVRVDHIRRWQKLHYLESTIADHAFYLRFSCVVAAPMSSSSKPTVLCLVFVAIASVSCSSDPVPASWPLQFHSVLFMNKSGSLELIDLWYDWPNGRNFNIIQAQQGKLLYDLEWTNGTSFFYTLDSSRECSTTQFQVGILRPDWLVGANYLGQRHVDGFLCNVWEKVDFIWYYEDVVTKRPVHWVFHAGQEAHVMTFEVGAVLEDLKWQAPVYCFDKNANSQPQTEYAAPQLLLSHGRFPMKAAGF